MNELLVLIDGSLAGVVVQHRTGDLLLSYESSWQDRMDASVRNEGIDHEVVDRLEVAFKDHAEQCLAVLSSPA